MDGSSQIDKRTPYSPMDSIGIVLRDRHNRDFVRLTPELRAIAIKRGGREHDRRRAFHETVRAFLRALWGSSVSALSIFTCDPLPVGRRLGNYDAWCAAEHCPLTGHSSRAREVPFPGRVAVRFPSASDPRVAGRLNSGVRHQRYEVVNWRKITACAAALLAAQFGIGFFEGAFAPAGFSTALVSCLVSFIVCGGIFAHLSASQTSKPFTHAWAALAVEIVAAVALSQVLPGWLGSTPLTSVALEWLVLVCALLVGTAVGSSIRRSTGHPADA